MKQSNIRYFFGSSFPNQWKHKVSIKNAATTTTPQVENLFPKELYREWQRPISQVRVRAASPNHIRYLTLRRRPLGPNVGRIWSARTVDYKTLKPYPGGLFCESVFGPVVKGRCACGRTRRTQSQRVSRICVSCGKPTSDPTAVGIGEKIKPGICPCNKTTTEIKPGEPVFCGYCGTEITLDSRARRYRLGYLPLAAPIAHPWYYRGQPHYLAPLLGFSRRKLEFLLKCEGGLANQLQLRIDYDSLVVEPTDFAPAERLSPLEENTLTAKGRRSRRRRTTSPPPLPRREVKSVTLLQHITLTFPWYCLYRDNSWRPVSNDVRRENCGRDREGLGLLTTYLVTEAEENDQIIPHYQILPGIIETRPLSDHAPRTGGDLILNRLQQFDTTQWVSNARESLLQLDFEIATYETRPLRKIETIEYRRLIRRRAIILRRLRILAELRVAGVPPAWLRLQCLPVLPADLRPAIPRGEGLVRVSDVNKLYQRVISRNLLVAEIRRETTIQENVSYRGDLRYAQRLLQEGVDALIENGRGGAKPETDARGRRLKSLAETLKGKRGRFRRNLLGKRVDYSGRSVIVSGPERSLHQCGLPAERAVILLQPFLLRHLRGRVVDGVRIANRLSARKLLENPTKALWQEIAGAAESLPILLNRAPTLHRFGFQAFQPSIISGRAIRLHPLACSGFNADFDGDQRAVHIPLSARARAEAWRLRTPGSHFFSPATGEPAFLPSQDRVLGCYYLTTTNWDRWDNWVGKELVYSNFDVLRSDIERNKLHPHQPIWVGRSRHIENEDAETPPLELRLYSCGEVDCSYLHQTRRYNSPNELKNSYIRTTVGRARRRAVLDQAIYTGNHVRPQLSFFYEVF